jgi:hypothetical protein
MTKICTGCKQPIHPKRLEILPSATRCVACSTATKKAGITITKGEGDHTYTETVIMEHDEFVKYKEAEAKLNNTTFDEISSEDEYVLPPEEQDENHDALDFSNIGED